MWMCMVPCKLLCWCTGVFPPWAKCFWYRLRIHWNLNTKNEQMRLVDHNIELTPESNKDCLSWKLNENSSCTFDTFRKVGGKRSLIFCPYVQDNPKKTATRLQNSGLRLFLSNAMSAWKEHMYPLPPALMFIYNCTPCFVYTSKQCVGFPCAFTNPAR